MDFLLNPTRFLELVPDPIFFFTMWRISLPTFMNVVIAVLLLISSLELEANEGKIR